MSPVRLGDVPQQRIAVQDSSQIGEVRRAVERLTSSANFTDVARGRAAIVACELATNLVRHAGAVGGGEILLQLVMDDGHRQIEIIAIDRGPGMDIDRCLRDGYSTGGTSGNGLGAVARLSADFDIYSVPGRGTVVLARVAADVTLAVGGSRSVAIGAISVALKGEIENGDTWRAAYTREHVALLVVDGLGHGPLAASASALAAQDFAAKPFRKPEEALTTFHHLLSGTRGAAASCALIERHSSVIRFAGVGNVSGSLHGAGKPKGMACFNGTLGVVAHRIRSFDYSVPPKAIVVMHTDGLHSRWSLEQHVGLIQRHPAVIAAVLYRDHARTHDDVTVVIAKAA